VKNETHFFNEWFAVDLVKNQDGAVVGVIALSIETGEVVYVKSKATVFATGGAGRIYASTTNAFINTGDGHRHGPARRLPDAGHGDVAVPPDRHLRAGHAGHRGLPGARAAT
jgi:hypothetical protein